MSRIRNVVLFLVLAKVALLVASGPCFSAEKYPSRPIQAIVPFPPGGATDLLARTVEKIWVKYSPQPWIVVNKPGAGGVMGTEYVVRSNPDGYTLYFGRGSGHDLIMPHLQKMPYDVHKELAPVARLTINSVVVCVSSKSPINSMKDLIDWAKKGNRVTAAVSTAAGSLDLVFKAFTKRTGVPIVTVPFSGGAEAVTALAGGHLQIGGGNPNEVIPHIKAGRFKAIGVALDYRDETLPNVPTLKEQGIDVSTWGAVRGVAVPAATPPEIIEYLSATLKKVSEDEEYKKIMVSMNQPNYYQNTKDFTAFLQRAYKDYGDMIKELDIKM
jgi:tripartite-type tricarboxylate transporter receptor subunit TctC